MPRVLIVDDSAVARTALRRLLESSPDISVAGECGDGRNALAMVRATKPDVITMDFRMPGVDGYRATAEIMKSMPRPIIMIGADDPADAARGFRALEAGALMVLRKPMSLTDENAPRIAAELVDAVRRLAQLRPTARADRGSRAQPAPRARPSRRAPAVVAIAASTGGPAALARILRSIREPLSAPILVVQHIAEGFDAGLAGYLNTVSPLTVRLAASGDMPRAGEVLIAPSGRHLTVGSKGRLELRDDPPVWGHRPSADPFFRSIAAAHGSSALAVILTGIGKDGRAGLADVRRAGGRVIAQDQETSVIWGMPGAAVSAGAVHDVLPLDEIAPALVAACGARVVAQDDGRRDRPDAPPEPDRSPSSDAQAVAPLIPQMRRVT